LSGVNVRKRSKNNKLRRIRWRAYYRRGGNKKKKTHFEESQKVQNSERQP